MNNQIVKPTSREGRGGKGLLRSGLYFFHRVRLIYSSREEERKYSLQEFWMLILLALLEVYQQFWPWLWRASTAPAIHLISLLSQFKYSCCIHPYPSVILTLHLRRRYYFYMVNLVVPCSLIAVMVLLSFILPPESGERIGLGITVLMAMAIFQELTSNKLPADSQFIPLLGNTFSYWLLTKVCVHVTI